MKFATFIVVIEDDKTIKIPNEVFQRLRLAQGDRVEVSLKKIKSKRLDLLLSENPLYRILNLDSSKEIEER